MLRKARCFQTVMEICECAGTQSNICVPSSNCLIETASVFSVCVCMLLELSMRSFGGFTIDFSASREATAENLQKVPNNFSQQVNVIMMRGIRFRPAAQIGQAHSCRVLLLLF